jgi:hypothetical protein
VDQINLVGTQEFKLLDDPIDSLLIFKMGLNINFQDIHGFQTSGII